MFVGKAEPTRGRLAKSETTQTRKGQMQEARVDWNQTGICSACFPAQSLRGQPFDSIALRRSKSHLPAMQGSAMHFVVRSKNVVCTLVCTQRKSRWLPHIKWELSFLSLGREFGSWFLSRSNCLRRRIYLFDKFNLQGVRQSSWILAPHFFLT